MMYVVERNKKVRLVGRRKRYRHRIPVRRSVAKSAANIGRAGVPMASETCLVDHWSGRADVPHVRLEVSPYVVCPSAILREEPSL